MLKLRVITALILIPVILSAVYFLPGLGFAAILLLITGLGAWEWASLCDMTGKVARCVYVVVFLDSAIAAILVQSPLINSLVIGSGLLWWLLAVYLTLDYKNRGSRPYSRTSRAIIGMLTLLPAILAVHLLHTMPSGRSLLVYLLILIWIADTGAYFAGKRFGKTRLCPAVSPGKTREGAAGAVLACLGFSLLYSLFSDMQAIEIMIFLALSLITVVISIFGDLLVSLIKREANMKDSGNLLPGHGGILDRIDSLLAAAPVFLAGIWLMEVSV